MQISTCQEPSKLSDRPHLHIIRMINTFSIQILFFLFGGGWNHWKKNESDQFIPQLICINADIRRKQCVVYPTHLHLICISSERGAPEKFQSE